MKEKIDDFWIVAMEMGAKMGCHQRQERSFFIRNYQFPICARCTGIVVSTIISYVICLFKKTRFIYGIILCIPMIIDGGIQYLGIKESTNLRRLITGLLGGAGLTMIRLNIYGRVVRGLIKTILG